MHELNFRVFYRYESGRWAVEWWYTGVNTTLIEYQGITFGFHRDEFDTFEEAKDSLKDIAHQIRHTGSYSTQEFKFR